MEEEEKKIEIEQQNLVEPETSKEVSRYSPKANPSAKPEIYKTLDVFKQSTSEGTIIKGSPKSKLSSVNSKFASIFSDSDLMQTSKWEVYKIDSLGRITFSATDDKGRVHELDWTSAGAANDFYVKIAKTLNFKFEKFVVDRLNNRLIKKPAKYLADNPRNNEYTSAAVTNPYINCSDIDDVKVIFGSNQYNGFYLPLYVEGNNSIDISFDYMIKYDSETLYDCVGNYDRFCGLPAIFNRNSLNNIDCVNFAIFIDSDDSANATQIRNDLYDVYYNSPDQKKEILQEFQEYGLQAEPTAECCEALGGRLVYHDDWSYINELWVKNINNKYKELLNDPTDIANILDSTDLTSQTKIVDVLHFLIKYRDELDDIRDDCMTFTPYNYSGEPCDTMNFYIELITTQQVCALEVTEKCGIYSKILWDFNGILAEIEYMLQVVDSCVQTKARVGNLITEIDAEIVEISTELSKTGDNSSTEIENTELEIEALDKNLTLVTVDISAKEEDNDTIAVALVDTEPESDCTIYEEQIEELNNFSVSDYCKGESRNKDFYNKKEEINFYNTCIKEKTNSLNKEKQIYIRLREECKKLVSLNGELEEAKNKNQTDVIPALEKTISETKHTIDNIREECGSIVATNESLQLNRKLNTADIAVINRVAVILNTTPAKISDNDKLSLTDDEKIKLRVIQTKNTVSLNKWNSEVSNINESKSKKEQSIAKLKREETLNKKELNKSLDSVINQKGRLENGDHDPTSGAAPLASEEIYGKTGPSDPIGGIDFGMKTGPSEPMGGIDIGAAMTGPSEPMGKKRDNRRYFRCINRCMRKHEVGSIGHSNCHDACGSFAAVTEGGEEEQSTIYYRKDGSSDPEKCCENVEEWLNDLKTKMVTTYSPAYSTTHQEYGLGNVLELTNNCYDEWYQQILSDYNIYINEVANSYLTYLNNLSLDFNIEVNNCLQGACPLSHVDSNIITTPYGVEDLWDFKYINTDYSGVIIEGDKSGDVIASIYQEIANITSQITPPQTMSQTLFDPKWRTFNYSLPGNVCDLLKICYPGKEFFISLEIENFDCGVCILIDNIKINTNSYIVDNITASNDCLIPELTCIIDNKKSWVYTDKGVKVKTTYPAGPCTSGITDGTVILTTPQNRLWQDLEYRYTEYDVNHSNLILNTKSASISIDPAKSIECDVYNFWRQINCDECPTTCDSGTTILYDGVIRETSSASLSAYTLSLSGTPAGISFSCDTYTDILTSEVSNLKNEYYSLTADLNESLSATYDDLKSLGGSLSNFTIQENNCESQTLVIGDYKDLDELFGLLIEESDGTLGFWETYVYNTTTPFVGGNHIEIFSGYTAQTFNQTSGVTEECCKSINTILNGTGKLGMGLGKEYEWNTSLNACTWTSIGDCNGDCEYSGTKDVNSISGTGTDKICEVTQVPVCINPINFLDKAPSTINVKQVFDDLVLKNLIDAKSRQTISGYPLLQLFYQLYLNANNCGEDLSGKLTYNNLFEFMDKIGDYWLDLIEQVVPTTTIWEGCEPSGKIYRNTIFDQNKYPYKKYTLNYIEIPEQCESVSGVTSESIGQATADIKVIEDCTAGGCLDESYVKCRREEYLIGVQMQAIQKEIDFIDEQISAYNGGQTTTLNCQYTQAQIDKLQNIDKPYYATQLGLLQTEKTNKSNECDGISNDIITANNQLAAVEQSCSSVASRISVAETKLTTLDVNTLPYEKQKTYIAVLKNEYRKCMRSTEVNISNYNTVFITQIYDSNEFEGNVIVLGDDEWDGDGSGDDQPLPGAFYNTELIHNCND